MMVKTKQIPIRLTGREKRSVRTQFGALCYRIKNDKVQILLISSRTAGRWVIPKGWPMHKMTPAEASSVEAYEEAGVEGTVLETCLGIYSLTRQSPSGTLLPCVVAVFPMKVKRLLKSFPEADQRKRKWFSRKKAAKLVQDIELAHIIKDFDPSRLPK